MRFTKRLLKWILYLLLIPISYVAIALILSSITIDRKIENQTTNKTIYLTSNGVHLDLVIPKKNIDSLLLSGLEVKHRDRYLSFGWGDENFYINTPTWRDLTFKNAFTALFLNSSTIIHLSRHKARRSKWRQIKISEAELKKLNHYIQNTFKTDKDGKKIILKNQGYSKKDDFFKANGSYSCLKTCNSWVNTGFKQSGLTSCFWTPFDFGLLRKYE